MRSYDFDISCLISDAIPSIWRSRYYAASSLVSRFVPEQPLTVTGTSANVESTFQHFLLFELTTSISSLAVRHPSTALLTGSTDKTPQATTQQMSEFPTDDPQYVSIAKTRSRNNAFLVAAQLSSVQAAHTNVVVSGTSSSVMLPMDSCKTYSRYPRKQRKTMQSLAVLVQSEARRPTTV